MVNELIVTTPEIQRALITEILESVLQRHFPKVAPQPAQKETATVEYCTRNEAAKILKVSLVTLNDWSKNGTIKAYRIGTRVRYVRTEIESSLHQFITSKNRN